jgi:hypothetical protein
MPSPPVMIMMIPPMNARMYPVNAKPLGMFSLFAALWLFRFF